MNAFTNDNHDNTALSYASCGKKITKKRYRSVAEKQRDAKMQLYISRSIHVKLSAKISNCLFSFIFTLRMY